MFNFEAEENFFSLIFTQTPNFQAVYLYIVCEHTSVFGVDLLSKNCRKHQFCFRFVVGKLSNIMSTLSLTILPAKALKDGRNKVRIAVAHNGQTRYIVTDVVIDSPREWKNGQIVRRDDAAYLNTKLRKKLNEVQQSIDELPYTEGLTCPELIASITSLKATKGRTLQSVFDEMLSVASVKQSTQRQYANCFTAITRHIPPATLVSSVTPYTIRRYVKARKDLSHSTLQLHIVVLTRLMNYCQANGYTDFRINPTSKCIKQHVDVRQNWLTPDQVRFIRDYDGRGRCRKFRDMFMLSYYLGGMNPVDLLKVDFSAPHIKYMRTKTENAVKINPYVEFDVPDEAKPIIAEYIGHDGCLKLFGGKYATGMVSTLTVTFRNKSGMSGLTFYSARKSFAQHAFQLGISESVIDYILGHSLNAGKKSTIYSYIQVTPAMATEAIRKVCDFIHGNNNFD